MWQEKFPPKPTVSDADMWKDKFRVPLRSSSTASSAASALTTPSAARKKRGPRRPLRVDDEHSRTPLPRCATPPSTTLAFRGAAQTISADDDDATEHTPGEILVGAAKVAEVRRDADMFCAEDRAAAERPLCDALQENGTRIPTLRRLSKTVFVSARSPAGTGASDPWDVAVYARPEMPFLEVRATRCVARGLQLSLHVSDRQIRAARTPDGDLAAWVRTTLPHAVELYFRGRNDPNPRLRLASARFRHLVPGDRPPAEGGP